MSVEGESPELPRERKVIKGVRLSREEATEHIFSKYGSLMERMAKGEEDKEPSFEEAADIVFKKHDEVLRLLAD